ncbi:aminotransferase DegT [Cohnella faecalis]|uniref:Aminotransferase DegT n=2 Tax=Cohnella faecalis TaxID=2315694 RepID=A0A398CWT5_9BACL|nr:aminotransferase DegT [Cohnella faecalis]
MSEQGYEKEFVNEAFDTNWIAPLGLNVDGFEKELAEYVGIDHAAALTSGTAAIHLALKAVGVREGDIVFCSSLTFAGSVNPVLYEKAIPVFIDSDYETWNMSPVALAKAYEKYPSPKAVIVVNLYGQAADYDAIREVTDKYGTPIIEDAAESLGATYKGIQTGMLGDIGIFSFNGNKIITTSGGGMLVCKNEDVTQKAKFWATQARDNAPWYQHSELGYNYRISNIAAGIGRGQLKVLNERIEYKTLIYEFYKKSFSDIAEIQMMPVCEYGSPNYWLSSLVLDNSCFIKPNDIIRALATKNIESRPIWKPMHMQPLFSSSAFFSSRNEESSVSEDLFNRGICLPSDTKMTLEDMQVVVGIIRKLFGKTELHRESLDVQKVL